MRRRRPTPERANEIAAAKVAQQQVTDRTGMNTYVSGPQGSAVPLTRVQRLEQALDLIRSYAEAWADPEAGDAIIAIIDRLSQPAEESG